MVLREGGSEAGPISTDEVRRRLAADGFPPNAFVWREGFENWQHPEEIPEFKEFKRKAQGPNFRHFIGIAIVLLLVWGEAYLVRTYGPSVFAAAQSELCSGLEPIPEDLRLLRSWCPAGNENETQKPLFSVLREYEFKVVRYTSDGLFAAYEDNEVATDIALKGKIVEVSGPIQSINKDVLDHIYVSLATRNEFMSAQMNVISSQEAQIATLHKGQIAVFRCPKMQRWAGSPWGDDCVLMSAR